MLEALRGLISDFLGGIYDFSKIVLLVDGKLMQAIMGLNVEFTVPGVNVVKGFNGDNGYNMDKDRAGVIRLKVSDCTMENANLMNKNFSGNRTVQRNFNVRLLDANGGATSYMFRGCQIMNRPNNEKKEMIGDLEYFISFTDFDVYYNGIVLEELSQIENLF
jgi:hypothetical protein